MCVWGSEGPDIKALLGHLSGGSEFVVLSSWQRWPCRLPGCPAISPPLNAREIDDNDYV